jgi:hypothetical protein
MLSAADRNKWDMLVEEHILWVPESESDKEEVLRQMERLLATSHFRKSRRYPALFRFVVEETLAGRGEFLKERRLGVEVFGRPSDYDTAEDPVVRVTVAEIRKRIAQYYHDEGHAHELRIELLPGRYEPEFRVNRDAPQLLPDLYVPAPTEVATVGMRPESESITPPAVQGNGASSARRARLLPWAAGILMALTVAVGVGFVTTWRVNALERFWAPVLSAHQPVIICLPVAGGKYGVAASSKIVPPEAGGHTQESKQLSSNYLSLETLGENVVFSDVRAALSLSDLLAQHKADQRLRLNTAVTLDDLRQGPTILIGAMDNPWTLRALSKLRFQFDGNDQEIYWIVDTKTGQTTPWSLDLKKSTNSVTRDYAIIARIHAEDTGQPQVIVAGIGMSGTAAAGELLTSPALMESLRQRVGKSFDKADFEAVIGTEVVNGIAGSPTILTVSMQ